MEYIFETLGTYGTLETKAKSHTNLIELEFYKIKHKVNGKTVIDSFRVHDKFKTEEDLQGYCHDYYNIDYFNRDTDEYLDECFGTVEDAMCEEDETLDERLATIEDAICELDEMLNGGE